MIVNNFHNTCNLKQYLQTKCTNNCTFEIKLCAVEIMIFIQTINILIEFNETDMNALYYVSQNFL